MSYTAHEWHNDRKQVKEVRVLNEYLSRKRMIYKKESLTLNAEYFTIMNKYVQFLLRSFRKEPAKESTKNVALVLGGGGARGFAHIGAIEALEAHGYKITSIAGTSMGALVGGLYVCGKLDKAKEIILELSRKKILSLIDISPGLDHIATADKLTELITSLTDNVPIEHLPIPFCCVASDLVSGKEQVFDKGSLAQAIRCSISIPGLFSPVHLNGHVFVDGSVHNTLPLNRIRRNKGDLLVAVNASAPEDPTLVDTQVRSQEDADFWNRIIHKLPLIKSKLSDNFLMMALRLCQMVVEANTEAAMKDAPPDICIDVPINRYGILEFDKGKEIIEYGRSRMEEILTRLQNNQQNGKQSFP